MIRLYIPGDRLCRFAVVAVVLCVHLFTNVPRVAHGQEAAGESPFPTLAHRQQPQWSTGPRLLKLGETIDFEFFVPPHIAAGELSIFPQYLERAEPARFSPTTSDLGWLEVLERETLPLTFRDGRAVVSYAPRTTGSYLARWCAGTETMYRYFAAIENDSIVLRFSTFIDLEVEPSLHATGIPLDYRLPIDRFAPEDPLFVRFLGYHRQYGDAVIPHLPDTPQQTSEERLKVYGDALERVRSLMPNAREVRSARVEMHHELDPGYTRTLTQLGINDHCGLNEANAKPWLGMPEFPYFASLADCRKMNQETGGAVLAHQWDFCGGWHFIGPVSWHYKAASGDWVQAERCIRDGVAELANLAELSGHPAFAVPLYDGLVGAGYPNPAFVYDVGQPRNFCGQVDDVFLCDHALNHADLARVMRDGAAGLERTALVWTFDEGQGARIHDQSGNGYDGQLVAQPKWSTGKQGTAIDLNGERDAIVADRPLPLCGDFAIGCWVKPGRSQRAYANLLSSHNNDHDQNHRGLALEQDGEHANRFYLIAGTGTQWVGTGAVTQLQPDVWQHFAVVRQGDQLTHYLNGEVSAEATVPAGPFAAATDPWRVGDWARGQRGDASDMLQFVERYQRLVAFELPKQHRVVFARTLDIADYYRRHFPSTPRTVFVSKTDHLLHDMWWLCTWCGDGVLVPRETIPWDTRPSSVFRVRDTLQPCKDPLSCEYVLIEDQQRQMRFERECPNPIWWFDYTQQEVGPEGSHITYTRTPDVIVRRSGWIRDGDRLTMRLHITSPAEFPNYALCLWAIPAPFSADRTRVDTTAKDFILVKNTAGEFHLVLLFDLVREMELVVNVR
jgi:hypothetical protein